mmetsp:Transcript_28664/g.86025  ORF Transcript_28664/g.86025 Transcript_28664/m.86025 type:complete len:278 (-) Transcript_28664:559-1392(-)
MLLVVSTSSAFAVPYVASAAASAAAMMPKAWGSSSIVSLSSTHNTAGGLSPSEASASASVKLDGDSLSTCGEDGLPEQLMRAPSDTGLPTMVSDSDESGRLLVSDETACEKIPPSFMREACTPKYAGPKNPNDVSEVALIRPSFSITVSSPKSASAESLSNGHGGCVITISSAISVRCTTDDMEQSLSDSASAALWNPAQSESTDSLRVSSERPSKRPLAPWPPTLSSSLSVAKIAVTGSTSGSAATGVGTSRISGDAAPGTLSSSAAGPAAAVASI